MIFVNILNKAIEFVVLVVTPCYACTCNLYHVRAWQITKFEKCHCQTTEAVQLCTCKCMTPGHGYLQDRFRHFWSIHYSTGITSIFALFCDIPLFRQQLCIILIKLPNLSNMTNVQAFNFKFKWSTTASMYTAACRSSHLLRPNSPPMAMQLVPNTRIISLRLIL